ncbi:MAG: glycosyltransferase [Candidatus Thiodiazotropha sp.]
MKALKTRKIVHLTSVHVPFDTRIFEKMCASAHAAGMQVVLVARHDGNDVIDGITLRGVKLPSSRPLRALFGGLKVCIAGYRENGDIYQIHDPELLPWSLVLRLLGKKIIYDMHENVPKAITTKHWIPVPVRRFVSGAWKLLEHMMLWRMPVIFAEESYSVDYTWVKNKRVIMNMPKLDDLASIEEPKRDVFTVGYLGAIAPERGSITMLKAVADMQQQGKRVGLLAIGRMSVEHEKQLRTFTRNRKTMNIGIEGFMRPTLAWRKMATCHAGLAMLSPIPNYLESYPTKIFEYMALGLPVIVSDFPLYRRVVETGRCGLCVVPDDVEKLKEAIAWLMEHPEEASLMGQRGRELVQKKYNWKSEEQKLLEFYRVLLDQS